MVIATHYELLGVPNTATADEIRDAYRASARIHHPDQAARENSGSWMAKINEAYRVLRDAESRARYDAALRAQDSAPRSTPAPTTARARTSSPLFTPQPSHTGPARYPWKLVGGMAAVGAVVVLFGAALYEPAEPVTPDNVLGPGSCVEIEENNDVREVSCEVADALVVETVVPFDQPCPTGLAAHRDRQGMGIACVARSPAPP